MRGPGGQGVTRVHAAPSPFGGPLGAAEGGAVSFPGPLQARTFAGAVRMGVRRALQHVGARPAAGAPPVPPGGPRTQAAGAVGTGTGGARRPGSRRPWLQSRLGRATRAHRDTDAHASGKITPRGHAHREPLEGRGCDGEREGIVTSFLGRVRQTQELTGDTGYEKNSCQNQNYLKRVTYVVTEI